MQRLLLAPVWLVSLASLPCWLYDSDRLDLKAMIRL
jgi:hypothetical protein